MENQRKYMTLVVNGLFTTPLNERMCVCVCVSLTHVCIADQ